MDNYYGVLVCMSPFVVLTLIVALIFRILRHNETMQYAAKGILVPDAASSQNGSGALRWGIVVASIGLALILGLWPGGFIDLTYPLGVGPWMLLGFIPFFVGLGLVIVHLVSRPKPTSTIQKQG